MGGQTAPNQRHRLTPDRCKDVKGEKVSSNWDGDCSTDSTAIGANRAGNARFFCFLPSPLSKRRCRVFEAEEFRAKKMSFHTLTIIL